MPALLTRMSRPPKRSTAVRTNPRHGFVSHVAAGEGRLAAAGADAQGDPLTVVDLEEPVHQHACAERGEEIGDAAADARVDPVTSATRDPPGWAWSPR